MPEKEEILKIEDVQELKNLSKKYKKKEIIYSILCALSFGLGWAAWINVCNTRNIDIVSILVMVLSYAGSMYSVDFASDYAYLKNTANDRIKKLTMDR